MTSNHDLALLGSGLGAYAKWSMRDHGEKSYPIAPVPAPRMTRSDKWKKRPCVERYFAFRDECRLRRVDIPNGSHITFVIPMPKSWSLKKQAKNEGQPHTQRPDLDNLLKAACDAIYDEDNFLNDLRATKVWGRTGAIIVRPMGVI